MYNLNGVNRIVIRTINRQNHRKREVYLIKKNEKRSEQW